MPAPSDHEKDEAGNGEHPARDRPQRIVDHEAGAVQEAHALTDPDQADCHEHESHDRHAAATLPHPDGMLAR